MNIPEVLKFLDKVVYRETGKYLNDLQRAIVEGTLQNQRYSDIGDANGLSEGHVKDVGYKLLQLLSDIFGEEVKKRNLKSVLKRQINFNFECFNNFGSMDNCRNSYSNCSSERIESETPEYQQVKSKVQKETAKKLKKRGLTDTEIMEILEITREDLKNL